jgi:hypothetical protein
MEFRQVPTERFPHGGVFVAEIDMEPREVAERSLYCAPSPAQPSVGE